MSLKFCVRAEEDAQCGGQMKSYSSACKVSINLGGLL